MPKYLRIKVGAIFSIVKICFMKKTRVFIAATALVLAIGGAAAVKANTKFATVYYQATTTSCLVDPNPVSCPAGSFGCTDDPGIGQQVQVYGSISSDLKTCLSPLHD